MTYTCERCGWRGEGSEGCGTHNCAPGSERLLIVDATTRPDLDVAQLFGLSKGEAVEYADKKIQVFKLPKGGAVVRLLDVGPVASNGPTRFNADTVVNDIAAAYDPSFPAHRCNGLPSCRTCGLFQSERSALANKIAQAAVNTWRRRHPRTARRPR